MTELKRRDALVALGTGAIAIGLSGCRAGGATTGEAPTPKSARAASPPKKRIVTIDAKPAPLKVDTSQTAVLVVDMQNDFGAKGGMFDRAGIDLGAFNRALPHTQKVVAAARQAGIAVVYLKMGYRPDLSDLGEPDSPNRVRHLKVFKVGETMTAPDGSASRILVRDTWNTDIVPQLKPGPDDLVMYKTRFSGFYGTALDAELKKRGIKYLIVTGVTTSVCVESTVRDAMFRDYLCVVLSDCTGEPIGEKLARSNHEATLLSVEVLLGWVADSERLTRALQSTA